MPRSSQLHQNAPLENLTVAFSPVGFIADELSPKYPVAKESNSYYVYTKDNFRREATFRADGAESNKATFYLSTATYQLEEHALHDDITDRQRDNADKAIRLDADVTENLMTKLLLDREFDLLTIVTTAANWSNVTSLTSTFSWSQNTTLSNPITFVDSGASVILGNSGKVANVIAMNDGTFRSVKEHTSVLDHIKYTSPQSVSPDMVARLLGVQKVLVSQATQNTAEEGLTDTSAFIMTDTAFLAYVEPTMGLKKPTAVCTFWKSGAVAKGAAGMVKKWREEKISSDRIEVSAMYQNDVVASDCAYLFVNTQ